MTPPGIFLFEKDIFNEINTHKIRKILSNKDISSKK